MPPLQPLLTVKFKVKTNNAYKIINKYPAFLPKTVINNNGISMYSNIDKAAYPRPAIIAKSLNKILKQTAEKKNVNMKTKFLYVAFNLSQ